ncbi:hypothetical protein [Mycobacterium antarcticum]|nr:hypothetical protein [Mycolicibacterium sp. TUM20984]
MSSSGGQAPPGTAPGLWALNCTPDQFFTSNPFLGARLINGHRV